MGRVCGLFSLPLFHVVPFLVLLLLFLCYPNPTHVAYCRIMTTVLQHSGSATSNWPPSFPSFSFGTHLHIIRLSIVPPTSEVVLRATQDLEPPFTCGV